MAVRFMGAPHERRHAGWQAGKKGKEGREAFRRRIGGGRGR